MVISDRVQELFDDARAVHASALRQLTLRDTLQCGSSATVPAPDRVWGDVLRRDAAEKAWCATKRATDALVLARTGEEPVTTAQTSDALDTLAGREGGRFNFLVGRYYSRISQLHGRCFYDGVCNSETERRIRETALYIQDAESLT